MELFLGIAVLLVVLIFLSLNRYSEENREVFLPYQKQKGLFTAAERSFYGALCQSLSGRAVVFAKVRIADIVTPAKGLSGNRWRRAFNRISAKHFDFVLCHPNDLSVIAVVELDDKSHNNRKMMARDNLVDHVCQSAGLPLHRFKARSSYNLNEVREKLLSSHAGEGESDHLSANVCKFPKR